MLDHEYDLLIERLIKNSGRSERFSFLPTRLRRGALSSITNHTAGWGFAFKPNREANRARSSSMSACWMKRMSINRKRSGDRGESALRRVLSSDSQKS